MASPLLYPDPALTRPTARRPLPRVLRFSFLLLMPALLGFLLYLHSFQLPQPTGPHAVGTTIFDLTDQSRHDPYSTDPAARREVVVQLWYPAEPSRNRQARYLRWREAGLRTLYLPLLRTHSHLNAPVLQEGAPLPVLLFSHRWNGQRTQDTALAEDLASHGYLVASIDHPHNAARTELVDDTVIRGNEALEGPHGDAATASQRIDFWNRTLQLWVDDERFALNQLAARAGNITSSWHDRIDTANAGALGHSFGGAAALALCGKDPRIKAAINLDGWTFGALHDRTAAQAILIFYEGASQDRERELATLPRPGSVQDQLDRADFTATEDSLRTYGGERLFLADTQHLDFSDEPLLPPFHLHKSTGPAAPAEVNTILRETIRQFFDRTLRGQPAPLLAPAQNTYPGLTVQHWPAPSLPPSAGGTK